MAKKLGIYKCNLCGNIVEVMHEGQGELVCCGKPMELKQENVADGAKEKHVPVVLKTSNGYKVNVGEVDHPMTNEHYIEWIELIDENNNVLVHYLNPNDKPEATFCTDAKSVYARAYCNLHFLYKSK
jgi:superoxide reductase